MKFHKSIGRFLTSIAILALLLSPIVRPAIALAATDIMDMSGMSDMNMPMSDDMPCCQDDVPVVPAKDCKQDCPFIALCIAASPLNLSASPELAVPFDAKSSVFPDYHIHFASLYYDPPLRPPQS